MNDIDARINSDLGDLAEATREGLGEFSQLEELIDKRPAYRDDRPGAEARRDVLIGRRRLELALMPLAMERLFVHRVQRATAAGVAAFAGVVMLIGIGSPSLVRLADLMMPGDLTVTFIGAGLAVTVLASYIIAGWLAERAFERRMREAMETSPDAYGDLDSLALGPLDHAKALVRKVDGWAVSLPLLAIAVLAPLFAYLTVSEIAIALHGGSLAQLSYGFVSGDLMFLALGAIIGGALALALGRACDRSHRTVSPPTLLRAMSHVVVPMVSVAAALVIAGQLATSVDNLHMLLAPTDTMRSLLAVGGTLAVTVPAAWLLLLNRRREQRRLTKGNLGV